jgi:glutathione S-transferase
VARRLVIGNRNYSSWSLRPWLALRVAGVEFEDVVIELDRPDTRARILEYSPTGRVPCLIDGPLRIWDSLAICETANERWAGGRLWPADADARARARAVVAEMHSGFAALRTHLPMDIRSRHVERGAAAQARPDVAADIARVQALWAECLDTSGGPFLFREFSIADAFYAPVITRFATYGVALPARLAQWAATVQALPAMQAWTAAAQAETAVIPY